MRHLFPKPRDLSPEMSQLTQQMKHLSPETKHLFKKTRHLCPEVRHFTPERRYLQCPHRWDTCLQGWDTRHQRWDTSLHKWDTETLNSRDETLVSIKRQRTKLFCKNKTLITLPRHGRIIFNKKNNTFKTWSTMNNCTYLTPVYPAWVISIQSAIQSRDTKEYFIPLVPWKIKSITFWFKFCS